MQTDDFGQYLTEQLHNKQMNRAQLSKQTGINPSTISRIITGKRQPTLQHLQQLAFALERPLPELLRYLEPQPSSPSLPHAIHEIMDQLTAVYPIDKDDFKVKVEDKLISLQQDKDEVRHRQMILQEFPEKVQTLQGDGPYISQFHDFFARFKNREGTKKQLTFIGLALLYFVIPVDVIPDYIFPIGYIDDVIAMNIVVNWLNKE